MQNIYCTNRSTFDSLKLKKKQTIEQVIGISLFSIHDLANKTLFFCIANFEGRDLHFCTLCYFGTEETFQSHKSNRYFLHIFYRLRNKKVQSSYNKVCLLINTRE